MLVPQRVQPIDQIGQGYIKGGPPSFGQGPLFKYEYNLLDVRGGDGSYEREISRRPQWLREHELA